MATAVGRLSRSPEKVISALSVDGGAVIAAAWPLCSLTRSAAFPKSSGISGLSAAAASDGSVAWLVLPFQFGYQLVRFCQKILGAWLPQLGRMKLCTLDKQFQEVCRRRSGHRAFLGRAARAFGSFNQLCGFPQRRCQVNFCIVIQRSSLGLSLEPAHTFQDPVCLRRSNMPEILLCHREPLR
jgi:hypothetical protein